MKNYKKSTLFTAIFFSFISSSFPQGGKVGINTVTPRTTLEVAGDIIIDGNLMLENPQDLSDSDTATFLIQDTNDNLKTLDVSNPTSSALGYIQKYIITNTYQDYVHNFDTGVDATDYVMISISSFYDQNLTLYTGGTQEDHSSLPYTYTFIDNGTWRIVTNYPVARNQNNTVVGTWTITTLIFSKDLSKQLGSVTYDMSGATTGAAVTAVID